MIAGIINCLNSQAPALWLSWIYMWKTVTSSPEAVFDRLGRFVFFFSFQLWLRTSNDSLVYLKKKQSLLASVCILQLLAAVMSCSTTHCQGVANKFSKIKSQGTLATRIYPTYVSRVWKILISNTRPYISKNRQNTSIATCVNPWESSWQHLTFPTQWLKTQVSHRKSNVQASM